MWSFRGTTYLTSVVEEKELRFVLEVGCSTGCGDSQKLIGHFGTETADSEPVIKEAMRPESILIYILENTLVQE